MSPKDDDHWFADNELVREEGILVSASGGHKTGCDEDECAPDETVEDTINEPGVPGTVDDLPYDFGVETAQAADETFESLDNPPPKARSVGATGPVDKESEINEREYGNLPEKEIQGIVAASGEDAEEVLPQSPDGVSATGSSAD